MVDYNSPDWVGMGSDNERRRYTVAVERFLSDILMSRCYLYVSAEDKHRKERNLAH